MTVSGLPTRPVERYVTQRELAELMGVSVQSVKRLTAAGMPSVTWGLRTRRYLPSVAMAWAVAQNARKPVPIPTVSTFDRLMWEQNASPTSDRRTR